MIAYACVLATTLLTAASDYRITVDSLGIGNSWRAGDITPISITVSNTHPDPVSAWIAWEVPDGDGDIVAWGRPLTLTPNQDVSTWLYAPTQPWARGDTAWTIQLRTLIDGVPSERLASYRFSPQSINASPLSMTNGAIAVVGTRRLGLGGLASTGKTRTVLEPTITIAGLSAEDLPDAWPSLSSIDTLVWANAPPELSYRQIKAIEEWVSRGGHLVIILPTIGDPWSLGSDDGPLASMLGDLNPTIGNIPLSSLHQVIGKPTQENDMSLTVRSFLEPTTSPLFTLPDGRIIAITKDIGIGACSIIGIDLADGRLAALGLPQADVFWNRVLGRRGDTPSPVVLQELDDLDLLSGTVPTNTTLPNVAFAPEDSRRSASASPSSSHCFDCSSEIALTSS